MRIWTAVTMAGLAALAVPGATRPLKPEQEALIKQSGPPVHCVQIIGIDSTRVRDDSTIDFYMRGRQVYRVNLPNSCPELGFEERFSYETSLSELCNTDIITVLHSSPPYRGASCGMGDFTPITGAPR